MKSQQKDNQMIYKYQSIKQTLAKINAKIKKRSEQFRQQQQKYDRLQKDYQDLIKLSHQSEIQNQKLIHENQIKLLQIEQLDSRYQLTKSRIQIKNQEIQEIKDQTFDIEKEKKKQKKLQQLNIQLKDNIEKYRSQIKEIQASVYEKQKQVIAEERKEQSLKLIMKKILEDHQSIKQQYQIKMSKIKQNFELSEKQKLLQEEQQKTKRNKTQALKDIKEMIQRHRQTYH